MTLIKRYERYILDNMDFSDYDLGYTPESDKEKIINFTQCFVNEYAHEILRQRDVVKAIKEYLQGLPSHTNIDFYNTDILNRAVDFGALNKNATEKQEDDFLEKYWDYMAFRIFSLMKRYKISFLTMLKKTKYYKDNEQAFLTMFLHS